MSFARIAAIAVAASVLWCMSAEAAGPLRPFKHGFWSGGAYTDDRTGAFTHCSAGVAYDSGINLFVLVTGSYRWWLGFINPQWSLTPNGKISVRLRLDDGEPFERSATIPSGQLMLVPLPEGERLADRFRQASELTLLAQDRSFLFKLGDAAAVVDHLTGCVRSSLTLAHAAPPASAAKPAAAAGESLGSPATVAAAAFPGASPPSAEPPAPHPQTSSPPATPSPQAAASAAPPPAVAVAALHSSPALSGSGPPADGAAGLGASSPPAKSTPPPPAPGAVARLPASGPPLAFTSVPFEKSAGPGPADHATGQAPAGSTGLPETATPIEAEEVRLARDFLIKAQLPNARLVFADKPPALAGFAAVWQADDIAGAVRIIPAGPQVSGIAIASNLIAVDPQMCKGNFTSSRSSANFDNSVVVSAILSCTQENERRTTQYLIAPRRKGGFVVFAVIGSTEVGGSARAVRQDVDLLPKAALQAADGEG
jgi:hypothetical protein